MKRTMLSLALALLLTPALGCLHNNVPHGNDYCGCGGCGGLVGGIASGGLVGSLHNGQLAEGHRKAHGWRHQLPQKQPAGPPSATVGYPYYTLHGPRDYFTNNPPSLGN